MKTSSYSIQYGTLNGIISISFSLMLFFLDQHYQGGAFVNLINFLISLTIILLAQIAFKKDNGGYLNLSDSLKLGLGIQLGLGLGWFLCSYCADDMFRCGFDLRRGS